MFEGLCVSRYAHPLPNTFALHLYKPTITTGLWCQYIWRLAQSSALKQGLISDMHTLGDYLQYIEGVWLLKLAACFYSMKNCRLEATLIFHNWLTLMFHWGSQPNDVETLTVNNLRQWLNFSQQLNICRKDDNFQWFIRWVDGLTYIFTGFHGTVKDRENLHRWLGD